MWIYNYPEIIQENLEIRKFQGILKFQYILLLSLKNCLDVRNSTDYDVPTYNSLQLSILRRIPVISVFTPRDFFPKFVILVLFVVCHSSNVIHGPYQIVNSSVGISSVDKKKKIMLIV